MFSNIEQADFIGAVLICFLKSHLLHTNFKSNRNTLFNNSLEGQLCESSFKMSRIILSLACFLFLVQFVASQSCHVILPKGYGANINVTFSNPASFVTWQLWDGRRFVNLTACSLVSRECHTSPGYTAIVYDNTEIYRVGLNIPVVKINETLFRAVTDTGITYENCTLEVYVWPSKPVCRNVTTRTYVDITCLTDNVYPLISGTIYRREAFLSRNDVDSNNTICKLSNYGAGSLGDYSEECTFRLPMKSMLAVNTFYLETTAIVSNLTHVNLPPVVSDDIKVVIDIPKPVIDSSSCPTGDETVSIGSIATCKCGVTGDGFLTGQARWYTSDGRNVGVENVTDGSSILTFSYNSSDLNQTYECRVINPSAQLFRIAYTPKFASLSFTQTIEKGHNINLECAFRSSSNTITWQVRGEEDYINLTTCSLSTSCRDRLPQLYQGHILRSSSQAKSVLSIASARINETVFRCLNDDIVYNRTTLEVYVWPSTPTCKIHLTINYAEVTCATNNVYPGTYAVLHREERDLTDSELDPEGTFCELGEYGKGSLGDYSVECTWRILMKDMLFVNTFYTEMLPDLSDLTQVYRPAAVSSSVTLDLGKVIPALYSNNCPVGPGVSQGIIKIGSVATCKCVIQRNGFLMGQARWYTSNRTVVGTENKNDGSSTLILSYNSSDPKPTFQCRAENPTLYYYWVDYTPTFN